MRPELFRIPGLGLPVYGYGAMIVVGFLLATHFAAREARRRGLPEYVHNLGMVMLAAGIFGGRVFYFIERYSTEFQDDLLSFFKIWNGGLDFYGGAIGGYLGGLLYLIWRRLPLGPCLDAVAAYVPIGMGFGRLGCFLNGCCYGTVCASSFPLGIIFPKENKPGALSPAFEEQLQKGLIVEGDASPLPVYPVQLYEAAYDFLLTGLLIWYLRGPSPRRGGFPLLFVLYGIGRFFFEYLRADYARTFTGLTVWQNVSLLLIGLFLPFFLRAWISDTRAARQAV